MPAYNHAPYIREAVAGVVAQVTDFDVELLIGEDCSTDETLSTALELQARHPDVVRVITGSRNVGMAQNFRRLVAASRGAWIALCEADDYWTDPYKLTRQISALERLDDVDLSFHSCRPRVGTSEKLLRPMCVGAARTTVIRAPRVIRADGGYMPTASLVVRRTAVEAMPAALYEVAPVLDYFIQVYGARRGGALYINRPMSVYRVGTGGSWSSSMGSPDKRLVFEQSFATAVELVRGDFRHYHDAFDRLLMDHYCGRAYHAHRTNNDALLDVSIALVRRRARHASLRSRAVSRALGFKSARAVLGAVDHYRGVCHRVVEVLAAGMGE
jgi:glycosyltransferase involved in cell wall biosynthesis